MRKYGLLTIWDGKVVIPTHYSYPCGYCPATHMVEEGHDFIDRRSPASDLKTKRL